MFVDRLADGVLLTASDQMGSFLLRPAVGRRGWEGGRQGLERKGVVA